MPPPPTQIAELAMANYLSVFCLNAVFIEYVFDFLELPYSAKKITCATFFTTDV